VDMSVRLHTQLQQTTSMFDWVLGVRVVGGLSCSQAPPRK